MTVELRLGDCMEIIKEVPDCCIDLIVTDPPYKFENQGGGFYARNESTRRQYLDSLKQIKCCEFEPRLFLESVQAKMKKFYGYFFCNKSLVDEYIRFAKERNYQYDILVMAKHNPIPAYNNHHLSDLEYIVMMRERGTYFSKHKCMDDYRKFYLTRCKKGIHPAEKPIELVQRFIRVSSQQGDTILDCFMGSGTTGVACVKEGRNFIGIEINESYYRIAESRIANEKRDKEVNMVFDFTDHPENSSETNNDKI
ncbi:MAG: hypothetical protein IJF84_13545 [Thermoguttaceae bacterium]|nr:hypothetical protein [Thermoguttaceae bacterium]